MEMKFEKKTVNCLKPVLQEVQTAEQTQEIRLPEGMPDIGRVLCAWGQGILRGKEWHRDTISTSGGMMVWVLYAPEDGGTERCIDAWVPFQMQWNLPEDTPEGTIRIHIQPRGVDARNVSPRKLMVRCSISALAEAYCGDSAENYVPENVPDEIALLRRTYPMRLRSEAGEKTFQIEEDLILPESAPQPERLVYFHMEPKLADRRVLSDKVVLRGSGNLHVLYRSEEGQLHSWDFEVPFSQFAQLDDFHEGDSQADLALVPTNLELEPGEDGAFRLKCSMVAQYVISDKQLVEVVEDAYAPGRQLELETQTLTLPVILETRQEKLYGEQNLPGQANIVVDTCMLPDFPRYLQRDDGWELEVPGTVQSLYYGEDGQLASASGKWQISRRLQADERIQPLGIPGFGEAQSVIGNGQILAKVELPVDMTLSSMQSLPVISAMELGEAKAPDPNRPSLILCRAGEKGLWELAKHSGSTVEAIRQANQLQDEPAPDQMLLIPVS